MLGTTPAHRRRPDTPFEDLRGYHGLEDDEDAFGRRKKRRCCRRGCLLMCALSLLCVVTSLSAAFPFIYVSSRDFGGFNFALSAKVSHLEGGTHHGGKGLLRVGAMGGDVEGGLEGGGGNDHGAADAEGETPFDVAHLLPGEAETETASGRSESQVEKEGGKNGGVVFGSQSGGSFPSHNEMKSAGVGSVESPPIVPSGPGALEEALELIREKEEEGDEEEDDDDDDEGEEPEAENEDGRVAVPNLYASEDDENGEQVPQRAEGREAETAKDELEREKEEVGLLTGAIPLSDSQIPLEEGVANLPDLPPDSHPPKVPIGSVDPHGAIKSPGSSQGVGGGQGDGLEALSVNVPPLVQGGGAILGVPSADAPPKRGEASGQQSESMGVSSGGDGVPLFREGAAVPAGEFGSLVSSEGFEGRGEEKNHGVGSAGAEIKVPVGQAEVAGVGESVGSHGDPDPPFHQLRRTEEIIEGVEGGGPIVSGGVSDSVNSSASLPSDPVLPSEGLHDLPSVDAPGGPASLAEELKQLEEEHLERGGSGGQTEHAHVQDPIGHPGEGGLGDPPALELEGLSLEHQKNEKGGEGAVPSSVSLPDNETGEKQNSAASSSEPSSPFAHAGEVTEEGKEARPLITEGGEGGHSHESLHGPPPGVPELEIGVGAGGGVGAHPWEGVGGGASPSVSVSDHVEGATGVVAEERDGVVSVDHEGKKDDGDVAALSSEGNGGVSVGFVPDEQQSEKGKVESESPPPSLSQDLLPSKGGEGEGHEGGIQGEGKAHQAPSMPLSEGSVPVLSLESLDNPPPSSSSQAGVIQSEGVGEGGKEGSEVFQSEPATISEKGEGETHHPPAGAHTEEGSVDLKLPEMSPDTDASSQSTPDTSTDTQTDPKKGPGSGPGNSFVDLGAENLPGVDLLEQAQHIGETSEEGGETVKVPMSKEGEGKAGGEWEVDGPLHALQEGVGSGVPLHEILEEQGFPHRDMEEPHISPQVLSSLEGKAEERKEVATEVETAWGNAEGNFPLGKTGEEGLKLKMEGAEGQAQIPPMYSEKKEEPSETLQEKDSPGVDLELEREVESETEKEVSMNKSSSTPPQRLRRTKQ
uniref:Uncharacterized protein n=1 Tax=Chromera velia CCMP2878 TaxID=1169474 RepID=A0A0G4FWL1_9ALVE|eukprot:Cvel_19143.t1-p1 / transcript=Cvel_19143.t1 / gene=Cvel_19143 / organism=Chromera_velia_CCMP2878 / gene_product=hypothetical protein / transcript_product=hypothetical protein / location=Cvel_scaffold1628:32393-35814(-) / protein_length=1091 / sequence_SO=supercontig / SO=protein_coding / is_pseudo=false